MPTCIIPEVTLMGEARGWILDCTNVYVEDEITVIRLVDNNYEGGWNAFAAEFIRVFGEI